MTVVLSVGIAKLFDTSTAIVIVASSLKPILEDEEVEVVALSKGSSAFSLISKFRNSSKTAAITPVPSIPHQNSSMAGSPTDRLEVSPDE